MRILERKDRLRFVELGADCEEMTNSKKSIDPGHSASERKDLRSREAREAIADHEDAQRSFNENYERLRAERIAREAATGPMLNPAPELPDDTPLDNVRFSTRIRKALIGTGWQTVGEVREASDATLLTLPAFGKGSVDYIRDTLGLRSADGVRPLSKKLPSS
jgi:DNA-directed RNA polymerase alpha subunit